MKILHIIDSLRFGGAQIIVKGIFESQKKNKNIFLFLCGQQEININHPNIYVSKSNKKYFLLALKELKEIIKKEKIEVLHCHLFKSQLFGWLLKKYYFKNIKLIQHEHGRIFENNFHYITFINFSQKKTDLFIAVSETTKKELIKKAKIPEKKLKVLYNFVDLDKFNEKNVKIDIDKEKKDLGIKRGEFVIGFVGRLSKEKGCEYLIKALPCLNFKYKVIIAGEGSEKQKLIRLAKKLKVKDKIIPLGYVRNISKIYPLFDVLVVPSIRESFGINVIEAGASRIPTICSNIGGLNELITNESNGLLFKAKNSNDLAKKINKLFQNKKNLPLMKKYSKKNIEKYSLKNYLINLKEIYKNI